MEISIRERIIDHTTRMFSHNGVKSVRMDDIAAEMGISKRTIYEIFSDKENLIMECLECFHRQQHANTKELTRDASNIIEEYLMMLEVWDKQVDMGYNMMCDVKKFYPKIYDKYTRQHAMEEMQTIKEKLQKGIDDGYLLSRIDLDLSLTVMGYSIYGMIKRDDLLPAHIPERDAFKYVVSYFIRGIATLKGIMMIDDYFDRKAAGR
jgi:AcrR family transcriptional regulator